MNGGGQIWNKRRGEVCFGTKVLGDIIAINNVTVNCRPPAVVGWAPPTTTRPFRVSQSVVTFERIRIIKLL